MAYMQVFFSQNIWKIEMPRPDGRSSPPTKLLASTLTQQGPQYSRMAKESSFKPVGVEVEAQSQRSGRATVMAEIR